MNTKRRVRFTVPTTLTRRRRQIARSISTWRPPSPRNKATGRLQSAQNENI